MQVGMVVKLMPEQQRYSHSMLGVVLAIPALYRSRYYIGWHNGDFSWQDKYQLEVIWK